MQLLFVPIMIILKDNLQRYINKLSVFYQHDAIQKAYHKNKGNAKKHNRQILEHNRDSGLKWIPVVYETKKLQKFC